ncbi:microsomal signal peptidase subunit [Amylocystis lapponica]|nr:microsomal signal peptidase subunit [Amylocystis lapponica]
MNNYVNQLIEGKIDFEGQKKVEEIVRNTLIGTTVVSFALGFVLQSLRVTFGTFGLSAVVLLLVAVPQWPMYNRNPVEWLPIKEAKESEKK